MSLTMIRGVGNLIQLTLPSDRQLTIESGAMFCILCLPCVEHFDDVT